MPCVSASVARSRSVGWLTAPSPRRRRQNASFIPDSAGPGRTSATAATVSSSVRASSIRNRCRIAGDSSWKQFSVSPAAIAAEAIASSSAIAPRSMALGSGPPAEEGYVAAEVGATGGSEQAASRGSREPGTGEASRTPSERSAGCAQRAAAWSAPPCRPPAPPAAPRPPRRPHRAIARFRQRTARQRHALSDRSDGAVAEEVHFDEPDRLDRAHLELRHDDAFGGALERQVVRERAVGDHEAAAVDGEVSRRARETGSEAQRLGDARLGELRAEVVRADAGARARSCTGTTCAFERPRVARCARGTGGGDTGGRDRE